MLFENPAITSKLPFPYNVPPPLHGTATVGGVPNLRFQTPIKAFACLTTTSNPIDNAAAAAAVAAAGLIDPHHNRELHNALVATMSSGAVVNGNLTNAAAVLKSQQNISTSSVTANPQTNNNIASNQQAGMVLLNGTANNAGKTVAGINQTTNANGTTNVAISANNGNNGTQSTSSGRSTPSVSGGNGSDPAPGKLFVGGLSWQTSGEKLKEYFNMFGTVTDVLIMKDPVTQTGSEN